MDTVKLIPATKDYLWGGEKLRAWGKKAPKGPLAECWELSFNRDAPSLIGSGRNAGKPLYEVATKEDLGTLVSSFPFFPTLIKLIDAAKPLSVQVHPSDDYALANEKQYGKTEMWRIILADSGSFIYLGFKRDTSLAELEAALHNGTILSLLNAFPVKPGESYFIPSGTIHAIGAGVTLLEIQQNSTLTYRLYDYDRLDKDGKKRELHIEKALKVINLKAYQPRKFAYPMIGACKYFTSSEGRFNGTRTLKASKESFLSFTIISGSGTCGDIPFYCGDTFFVPAAREARLSGGGVSYVSTEVKPL